MKNKYNRGDIVIFQNKEYFVKDFIKREMFGRPIYFYNIRSHTSYSDFGVPENSLCQSPIQLVAKRYK